VPEFAYLELLSFIKAQNIWMKWARDVAGRQSLSLATVHCPEKKGTSANVAISKSDTDNDGDVLFVSNNIQSTEAWLFDSASSFQMQHTRKSGSLRTSLVILA